jgi:HEAT repeat protein
MKDTLKKTKTQKEKDKFSLFAFYLLLLTCCFLAGLGCEEPFQRPEQGSKQWPAKVSIDELVPVATRIVQQGLADRDPYVRVRAVEVVATTGQIKLMPDVQRLLENDFVSPVRFAAALAVGDIEYRFADKSIRPLLSDPDENIRIAAAYALSKLGSFDCFDYLRKAIASDKQTVRANAALLMGKTRDNRSRMFLYMVLRSKDSDDKVRFQAVESIAMLGDEYIYDRLWMMSISTYADDRVMGIKAMGALGTPRAREILMTKLDDDILAVRLAAAEQLGMLGDTTGEPEVLDIFRKNLTAGLNPAELEHVNMLTALAIGQIRTESLSRFLPQLLRDQSKFVRIAAAKAVFQYAMKK